MRSRATARRASSAHSKNNSSQPFATPRGCPPTAIKEASIVTSRYSTPSAACFEASSIWPRCSVWNSNRSSNCTERWAEGGANKRALSFCRHVRAAPEVHGAELLASAGFEVQKQLRAICRVAVDHQPDDEQSARRLPAEHVHFLSEVCV